VSSRPGWDSDGIVAAQAPSTGADSNSLILLLYDELHALAQRWFRRQPKDHTLQPTALVHEVYLRLSQSSHPQWRDRTHFFAVAAAAMRRVLVDHARERRALKRGGGRLARIDLDPALIAAPAGVDIIALDAALTRLAALNERQSRIVELRFLGGLTVEETAAFLGVSPRTVKLDWNMARAWLRAQLRGGVLA
jgi:RNA polymerase sigma-70 factor, ECF subfamily